MRPGAALIAWAAILLFPAAAESWEIVFPSEGTLFDDVPFLNLVAERPPAPVELIDVRVNGRLVETIDLTERGHAGSFLCRGLRVEPGPVTLRVEASGPDGDRRTEVREVRVFVRSLLNPGSRNAPPGFAGKPFHTPEKERRCSGCHRMDPSPGDRKPSEPKMSSCFACHRRIVAFREAHGPAAVWDCLSCHDPESRPARYATAQPNSAVCYECHRRQAEERNKLPYIHGPTSTGKCTICHSPHGTDNPFWLKKPVWDLCTACHAEKADGRHVVAGFVFGETHPTRGRPDPTRPGKDLSCASCHNPHSAPSKFLWNFGVTRRLDLCRVCHKK